MALPVGTVCWVKQGSYPFYPGVVVEDNEDIPGPARRQHKKVLKKCKTAALVQYLGSEWGGYFFSANPANAKQIRHPFLSFLDELSEDVPADAIEEAHELLKDAPESSTSPKDTEMPAADDDESSEQASPSSPEEEETEEKAPAAPETTSPKKKRARKSMVLDEESDSEEAEAPEEEVVQAKAVKQRKTEAASKAVKDEGVSKTPDVSSKEEGADATAGSAGKASPAKKAAPKEKKPAEPVRVKKSEAEEKTKKSSKTDSPKSQPAEAEVNGRVTPEVGPLAMSEATTVEEVSGLKMSIEEKLLLGYVEDAVEMLTKLGTLDLELSIIKDSKVGMLLAKLKKHRDDHVSALARQFVKQIQARVRQRATNS